MLKTPVNSPAKTLLLYRIVKKLILLGLLTSTLSSCATTIDAEKQALSAAKKEKPITSNKKLRKHREGKTITKKTKPEIEIYKSIEKASRGDAKEKKLIDVEKKEISDQLATINFDLSNLRDRLVGMDGDGIKALLGFPAFKRSEPPAKIWQYRTKVCIVSVFLYNKGKELAAKYVDFRGRNKEQVDDEVCFKSIVIMNPANKKFS